MKHNAKSTILQINDTPGCLVLRLDRQGEFEKDVGGYFRSGQLKNKETVVKGIDQAAGAFIGLFEGKNLGKMVVDLS